MTLETGVEQDAQERGIGVAGLEKIPRQAAEDRAVVAGARSRLEALDRVGRGDLLVDDRLVERFLAREVAVESRLGDAHPLRELANRAPKPLSRSSGWLPDDLATPLSHGA